MKWCELYQCWCDEVDEVIDDPGYHCDLDCDNCDAMSEHNG